MDAKTIPAERLDGIDAERFRDMLASASFGLLLNRIRAEVDRAHNTCSTSTDPPELYRAQGAVAALRAILSMPKTILNEMANETKKRT